MKVNKQILFSVIAFVCLIIDHLSKLFVDEVLTFGQKVIAIPDILSFEKVYNTGAAFSLFQGNTLFLVVISVITIGLILFYVFRKNALLNLVDVTGLAFLAGGAAGNLADRLAHLYVVDFVKLEFIEFPVFNFADIFINIGVIILLFSILFSKDD